MNDPDFFKTAMMAGQVKAKKWLFVFKIIGALFIVSGLALGVPAVMNADWWNVFWGGLLLLLGLPTLGVAFFLESKLATVSQLVSTAATFKKQFDQNNQA